MDLFQVLFYQPIFNLMIFFSDIFGNIGWAIIIIALLAKLITIPLTKKQLENSEKAKLLQTETKKLQKEYKHNPEKLAKEMASLQAKALPGQLSGCFSIIIFLILFLQIRGVILDLVNRGYHAFNSVAYEWVQKKDEDSVKFTFTDNILTTTNNVSFTLVTDNGNRLEKVYDFELTKEKSKRMEEIKQVTLNMNEADKKKELEAFEARQKNDRTSDISVYNKILDESLTTITINQFLIFPTETKQVYLVDKDLTTLEFYIRPPSGQTIDYTQMKLVINGVDVTDNTLFTQGEKIPLDFAGMNLSRVASDFDLFNLSVTFPYIILSVLSAVSQYFTTKLYSMQSPAPDKSGDKKKDKGGKKDKKDDEEPMDMATAMAESSRQMAFIFPFLTLLMTLGYLGGATFFPTGVTLFWTAQNAFVIIQQSIANRKKIIEKLKNKFSKSN